MNESFRRPPSFWVNVLVILYTLGGWTLGLWLMMRPELASNVAGVLLVAHALVCSAYLLHDCAHHAVFATARTNDGLGVLMSWLNGACLATYQGLKKKHLRHHTDRLDVVTFDYRAALKSAPSWVRRSVLALEWAYVPAVELLMRGFIVVSPFRYGTMRGRVRMVVLIAVRVGFFAALALISVRALLLYAIAYLLFLHVLRFMDAFQHTYDVFVSRSLAPAPADPRRDRRYEYAHTFSNVLSVRWPWLNLLVLNFPYHNAHHTMTGVPWYRLPSLHRSLYGAQDPQVIPCGVLLGNYHRYRVARVLADDYGSVAQDGKSVGSFIGAVGVSFLTAV
jgi:fatty acid desaturase